MHSTRQAEKEIGPRACTLAARSPYCWFPSAAFSCKQPGGSFLLELVELLLVDSVGLFVEVGQCRFDIAAGEDVGECVFDLVADEVVTGRGRLGLAVVKQAEGGLVLRVLLEVAAQLVGNAFADRKSVV